MPLGDSARLALSERISVPKSGRTILSQAKIWGTPLLHVHRALIEALNGRVGPQRCRDTYFKNYEFLSRRKDGPSVGPEESVSLCAAAAILNWISSQLSRQISTDASLSDAEECVWNDSSSSCFHSLSSREQDAILRPLRDLTYDDKFLDILPYALEVFETSHEVLFEKGEGRRHKRKQGIFYTPSDLADFIIENTAHATARNDEINQLRTWLDPACGTGCFLVSALYFEASRCKRLGSSSTAVPNYLFGIDLSRMALQSAAFVLALNAVRIWPALQCESFGNIVSEVGKHLFVGDSTYLRSARDLSLVFPDLKHGADFVVSNPPYVRKSSHVGCEADLFEADLHASKNTPLHLSFVHQMATLSHKEHGAAGMVLPLSISYNTEPEFVSTREFISRQQGIWWFYHFDRTPDSLFGDDVKTRNCVIFYARQRREGVSIYSSDLVRWSSRKRSELFGQLSSVRLPSHSIRHGIPKIGDEAGKVLLSRILASSGMLGNCVAKARSMKMKYADSFLRNAKTAYNWLPFEMVSISDHDFQIREDKYSYWSARSQDDLPVVFSFMQSRFAYWLWRVWSDGFHLTNEFIQTIPFSPDSIGDEARNQLRILGTQLWDEMQTHRVASKNAGKVSISYCNYLSEHLITRIDEIIAHEYELGENAVKYVEGVHHKTVVAGRDEEIDTNPALSMWRQKEKSYGVNFTRY